MAVHFKELAGSPIEQYTLEGFPRPARVPHRLAGSRRVCRGGARQARARSAGADRSITPASRRSTRSSCVSSRSIPTRPEIQSLDDLSVGLNSYGDSLAKAVVEYRTIVDRDREDGPANQVGTHLTYRMAFSSESVPLASDGWVWGGSAGGRTARRHGAGQGDSDDRAPPRSGARWSIRRGGIHAMQGRVNAGEFLGCPAGDGALRRGRGEQVVSRGAGRRAVAVRLADCLRFPRAFGQAGRLPFAGGTTFTVAIRRAGSA